ncbi:21404_t:CDS:2, partial [Gigaspora margarita]
ATFNTFNLKGESAFLKHWKDIEKPTNCKYLDFWKLTIGIEPELAKIAILKSLHIITPIVSSDFDKCIKDQVNDNNKEDLIVSNADDWIEKINHKNCVENSKDELLLSSNLNQKFLVGMHDIYLAEDPNTKWKLLYIFVDSLEMLAFIEFMSNQ